MIAIGWIEAIGIVVSGVIIAEALITIYENFDKFENWIEQQAKKLF